MKSNNSHHYSSQVTAFFSFIAAVSTSLILLINIRNPDMFRSISEEAGCIGLSQESGQASSSLSSVAAVSSLERGHDFQTSNLLRAGLIAQSPFRTAGCSSHSLVVTAAYRGGPAVWHILGLQPVHISRYTPGTTDFQCDWIDAGINSSSISNATRAGRVSTQRPGGSMFPWTYITVVVTCEFSVPVGTVGRGGALVLRVLGPSVGGSAWGWSGKVEDDEWMYPQLRELYTQQGTVNAALVEAFSSEVLGGSKSSAPAIEVEPPQGLAVVAGTEKPQAYDAGEFKRVVYDNLYCGSSIYGRLDVLAVNEWLSYHLYLFGNKTHFVFYDAGAVRGNKEMEKALEHWVELGLLSINDLQELQMYPGYYHHQHHAINDCLNRYRFTAKRIWFMDVDEYIIVKPPHTLKSIIHKYQDQDVLMLKQHRFSDKLCRRPSKLPMGSHEDSAHALGSEADGKKENHLESWSIERLMFSKGPNSIAERKYVVLNPGNFRIRSVLVHAASTWKHHHVQELDLETEAGFYHYHGSISKNKSQLCGTSWLEPNATEAWTVMASTAKNSKDIDVLYEYDDAILPQAAAAKTFIRAFFAERNITSLV